MAFDLQAIGVSTTNYGGQPNSFTYTTVDADTVVETASYFDDFASRLTVGDMIRAELDTDGTPETKLYRVTAISAANVVTIAVFVPA